MIQGIRRAGGGARWLLAVALVGALLAGAACSGDDDDDADAADEAAADEPTGPVPGEDVAVPTVTGPVTEGSQDGPWGAMPQEVADQYSYVEEEYFIAGEATAYEADGELGEDGRWTVTPAGTAPYKTRVVVRRPEDPEDFDGTVFVEWFNVTAGIDGDPDFGLIHDELLAHGSAYVGVSAQQVGVEGGGGALAIPGLPEVDALKQWDPERYGELSHPGDPYSYDIYSQAAQTVRRPGEVGVDVLDGLGARHVIAIGESQSAARMVTYVDGVHPIAGIFDGYLIHSRGSGGAPFGEGGSPIGQGTARIRDDLDVPVLQYETETDLFGVLGFVAARQDDTELLRTWEVAGTAHADRALLDYGANTADAAGAGGFDLAAQCGSINEGNQGLVLRAAVSALRAWVDDGEAPPEAPPLEVSGDAIARDSRGIALGGIRTPLVDAPTSVLTGEAPAGRDVLCTLFGNATPFDAATLSSLYPAPQDYVDAVTDSAEAAVDAGFLLQADADTRITTSEEDGLLGS